MFIKILAFFKKILLNACAMFTFLIFLMSFFLVMWKEFATNFNPEFLLTLFGFSIAISLMNRILHIKKLPKAALIGIHFILCYAAFFVFIIAFNENFPNASFIIIATIVYLVIYAVLMGAVFGFSAIIAGDKNKSKPYISQYKYVGEIDAGDDDNGDGEKTNKPVAKKRK